MDLELRKKKAWSEYGVSEIVGNILILLITVTLFSGIMAFVQQMPVPQQVTKADFAAKLTFWSGGTQANLTVTHTGGVSMKTINTITIVQIGSVNKRYNMSDPVLGLKGRTTWSTGVVWAVTLTGTTYASAISVTVVDLSKKMAVWSSQVTGGSSGNPPSILQRYVDSDPTTPTADPVREWQDFSLFVTITDPDGDLNTTNGIWIDSSQLETDLPTANHRTDYVVSGDVYSWNFTNIRTRALNASDLDGHVIMIHAWDKASHHTISSFVMSVTQIPVDINYVETNPPEPNPSGDSVLPSYIQWFFDNQGFGIFAEKILSGRTTGTANTTKIVTSFVKDHLVFVRFASKVMSNVFTENELTLTDVRTGLQVVPRFNGSSTASKPFYPITGGGGIYLYECQFNTSPLPVGAYSLTLSLKSQPSTGQGQISFWANQNIFITDPGSPISFCPAIFLYKDLACTIPWGNTSTPYEVISADKYKVYVAVRVQDTDSPPTPSIADIRIKDGGGNSELFGTLNSGAMISAAKSFARGGSKYYNFSIDLRLNDGVQWRGGNQTYSLNIAQLGDSNEGSYSLSTQIFINGAGSRADFFVGTTGIASRWNSNPDSNEYLYYIQNSNLFLERCIYSMSTTGWGFGGRDYTVSALDVVDVDGDGNNDLLMAQNSGWSWGWWWGGGDNPYSHPLYLFQNTLNTFGVWQGESMITRPDGNSYLITWITSGDVTGDGKDDFAYANENGGIVIYNTTYGSSGWVFTPPSGKGWSTPINKIALRDMTGDGRADLVVLAGPKVSGLLDGTIYIYDLKYFTDPTLYADRGTLKKGVYAISTGASRDFDIADVNNDGMLDIVTADTSPAAFTGGLTGVNVNYWTLAAGTKKVLDTGATGYIPKVGPGTYWKNRTVSNTATADGVYWRFMENNTGIASQKGKLTATMKFQQLTTSPDQLLTIVARIGANNGTSSEVFYAWISSDGVTYNPIITIDSTSWKYYNYTLPYNFANKAIYLRFTDSNTANTSSVPTDYIDIDMAAVFTDRFTGYVGSNVIPNDSSWTCVRAASLDGGAGNKYLEVVAAKDDVWRAYKYTTSWTQMSPRFLEGAADYPGLPSSFAVSSAIRNSHPYSDISPTLFDVKDVNGDGYADIVVVNYTGETDEANNCLGFFMNLWDGSSLNLRYYLVDSWFTQATRHRWSQQDWLATVVVANLTVL